MTKNQLEQDLANLRILYREYSHELDDKRAWENPRENDLVLVASILETLSRSIARVSADLDRQAAINENEPNNGDDLSVND